MREITLNHKWNEKLALNGYVRIGKLDIKTFIQFKEESTALVNKHKKAFPKGELFNLINSNFHIKTSSNSLVDKYLNPYLKEVLNTNTVDVYPVSHIIKPFGWHSGIWHQDSAVVNENHDFSLNAWMPFVDSHRLNGCIWAIPGTHIAKNFKRQFGFNPVEGDFLKKIIKYMKPIEVKAGEVLLFYRNIIHGSSRNWLPFSRIAAESLITSKNAQFVNFHREDALHENKIIEYKVPVTHFLKENPKEDFYDSNTPYDLHDNETKDDTRKYLFDLIAQLQNN